MAKTLAQIQQQIAKLQQEADAIKVKEVSGVVERIKDAIAHYGLTVEDLFGRSAGGRKATTASKARPKKLVTKRVAGKGSRVPVKYRDDTGNTWTGRGNKPRWMVAALASGKTVEEFAVKV